MLSTHPKTHFDFLETFILPSANAFKGGTSGLGTKILQKY